MRYYTSQQKDNLIYVQAPKVLLYGGEYKDMMPQAKLLYIALIDKLQLSMVNEWKDEHDRYYVIMSIESGAELLGFSHSTFRRCKTELIRRKLIGEKRMGLNKPNRIYVGRLNYDENDTFTPSGERSVQNEQSGMLNESTHECQMRASINNKNIKNEIINNENIFVNKDSVNNEDTINKLFTEYRLKGLSKEVCFRVLDEVNRNPDVENFGAYLRTCLENTLYKSNMKRGNIDFSERFGKLKIPLYNWLED
ncbi:replication initiator protein A [Peribacillus frigoritolerans]|uniref:replication initiator protein A n=1 Tax=Peribacillus frigoritolerans TaxID=450367 RepID=UPI00140559B4|nr:replication initiator protein A [Peribacillus frigoritolerans]